MNTILRSSSLLSALSRCAINYSRSSILLHPSVGRNCSTLICQHLNVSKLFEHLNKSGADVVQSQFREKSSNKQRRKSKSKYDEDSSDSDSDNEDFIRKEQERTKGARVMQITADCLNVDSVLRPALALSRNKFQVIFYESRLRVNGKKILKKNYDVDVDDEIDVIKEIHPENPDCLLVNRVEILKAVPSGDGIVFVVRRQRNMMIQNYEHDPWVVSQENEGETTPENLEDQPNENK